MHFEFRNSCFGFELNYGYCQRDQKKRRREIRAVKKPDFVAAAKPAAVARRPRQKEIRCMSFRGPAQNHYRGVCTQKATSILINDKFFGLFQGAEFKNIIGAAGEDELHRSVPHHRKGFGRLIELEVRRAAPLHYPGVGDV